MALTYVTNRVFDPTTGMRPWVTKTSNYTAGVGDRIAADTTQGPFSITLPAANTFNEVTIFDPKYTWGTNALTILPGGNLIEGLNEPLICDVAGLEIKLRLESSYGWRLYTDAIGSNGGSGTSVGGSTVIPGGVVSGPAFSAYIGPSQSTYPSQTITKAAFNLTRYNIDSCYNTTTYRFTPTVPGYYLFTGAIRADRSLAGLAAYIFKNDVQVTIGSYYQSALSSPVAVVSVVIDMNGTTDYVDMRAWGSAAFNSFADGGVPSNGLESHFTGTLINATGNYVPPGTIISYATQSTIPAGWLVCNGANPLQADYPGLYQAIGTLYNPTPPAGRFTLPDLRGEFIRGWDDGRGIDTSRVFGSFQDHQFASHTHSATNRSSVAGAAGPAATVGTANVGAGSISLASAGGAVPPDETRPRNLAMRYLIKY